MIRPAWIVALIVALVPGGCRPKPVPVATKFVPALVSSSEFKTLLSQCVIPPEDGPFWSLTDEHERLLVLACTSAHHFDTLIDAIADIPEPAFPGPFLGYGTHHSIKDCPLGEPYVRTLADRLMKETRPKHRAVIRDAIQWHSFHEHARKWSPDPFVDSVPGRVLKFERRDEKDHRWYGVITAAYAPRFPEAEAEMWRAIRADEEITWAPLPVGAFETAFNGVQSGWSRFRDRLLGECLKFLVESRSKANPWAAGWMVKRQLANYVQGFSLRPGEVFEWERELHESASTASSLEHRGDAILGLFALDSPRALPALEAWLTLKLPDLVADEVLSELRIPETPPSPDPLAAASHPRLKAHIYITRQSNLRGRQGPDVEVSFLRNVLKTDSDPEMRRAALRRLAYWLREDPRDGRDHLPQGMSNLIDLLDPVSADPSVHVRRVLAEAFKRQPYNFPRLPGKVQERIRALLASLDPIISPSTR